MRVKGKRTEKYLIRGNDLPGVKLLDFISQLFGFVTSAGTEERYV